MGETTPDKAAQAAAVPSKDNDGAPSAEKQKKVKGGKSAKPEELQAQAAGAAAPAQDATQHAAFKEAEEHGLAGALKNLAARPEILKMELPAGKLLSALRENDGLVNKAKAALLGA